MPNTVHGPYAPHNWIAGDAANATRLNNLESQTSVALASINPDLLTAFVEQGIIASPDAVTANQLDVTAGVAYVVMTDGTVAKINVVSSTQVTSTINATYNLYLQPDGTWYWSTSNSPQANSLFIATVTTNGAGNILVVTDKRTLLTSLLAGILQGPGVGLLGTVNANSPQPGTNPGSIVGGVTAGSAGPIAGDSDTAMSFDGTTGYIPISGSGFPSANAAWSLEAWINASALPVSFATAVAFGAWGTTRGAPNLSIDSAGHVIAGTFSGDAASATTITANTWHHLVGTWDSTTLRCYLDGTQVATATPGALVVPATPPAIIGADTATTPGQMWKGLLDEVAIYSTTLSAGQVTTHYNAGHAGSATSSYVRTILGDAPLRYYRLGDASGRGVRQAIAATAPVAAADGSISPTYVAQVAQVATVGKYGVPVIIGSASDQAVTNSTGVNFATATTPNDGKNHLVRFCASVSVGAGATNNGTCNFNFVYSDPNLGAISALALVWSGSSVVVFSAFTVGKGGTSISTLTSDLICAPNTTVQIFYQNTAAGTISDKVSGTIELLS